MSRKIIINTSCFIICMALILFSTPVITSASTIYPSCCNINLTRGHNDERISWVDEVDLMYNIRDGASVIIESTFEDMDYDYVIEKMAKAKYINFCAFDRGTYCKYEDVAVDRLASLIRNLPEDYFSKVKVCYIGMNNSERLAWALREQGVKCVIFQKRESNVQEKKDMVRFFNNYFVMKEKSAKESLKLAKEKCIELRGAESYIGLETISCVGATSIQYK